jgi:hypothetical protein
MKRAIVAAITIAIGTLAAVAVAQTPTENPFPAAHTDVFVFSATYAGTGEQTNVFKAGSTVTFNAYAADLKTKKVLTPDTTLFFYVVIPGQPNLKLAYGKVGSRFMWIGKWNVPADFKVGVVEYRVLVKTKTHRYGSFVQPAVANAILTITA